MPVRGLQHIRVDVRPAESSPPPLPYAVLGGQQMTAAYGPDHGDTMAIESVSSASTAR